MKVINLFNFPVRVHHVLEHVSTLLTTISARGTGKIYPRDGLKRVIIPNQSTILVTTLNGDEICRPVYYKPSTIMYIGGATTNSIAVSTMYTGYTGHHDNPTYKPGSDVSQLTVINGSVVDAYVGIGPYTIYVPAQQQQVYTTAFNINTPIEVCYAGIPRSTPSFITHVECANTSAMRIGDIVFGDV